jgi:predicted porin
MQKKLIAIAIAGLSSVAFAQSNVTVSGRLSVNVDNVSANGATAGANLTSRMRVTDNQSNIRFAGEEALGGGTSAWFQVESAIGTSNNCGTAAGATNACPATVTGIGTRNTAIGMKGAWGLALAGKWDVHYATHAGVDGNGLVAAGAGSIASNSLNLTNYINGAAIPGSGRDNNVVAYVSPDFNGFKALIGYTFVGEVTTAGLAAKDKGWTFNPSYNNGPITAFWSYLNVNNAGAAAPFAGAAASAGTVYCSTLGVITVVAPAACVAPGIIGAVVTAPTVAGAGATNGLGADARSNKLGAAYTFPMGVKVGFIWDKSKITTHAFAGDTWAERSAWTLPLQYTAGMHRVNFTYGKTNNVNTQAGTLAATNQKMTVLGYEYLASKRTAFGVTWSQLNNDAAGVQDFWHPSSNVAGVGANVPVGSDPRSLAFTMTHNF